MSYAALPAARYVEELRHTVQVAALNFDVWWVYKQRRDRARFVEVLNAYPLFFQTSLHAHFVALLVALYQVYEKRTDTFNVHELMRRLENEKAIPRRILTPLHRRVAGAKKLSIKMSVLRNKAFAHRANAHSVGDVFRQAQVEPNDLRRLLHRAEGLLNQISHALNRSSPGFNLGASTDTKRMLTDLKAFHDERSKRPLRRTTSRGIGEPWR